MPPSPSRPVSARPGGAAAAGPPPSSATRSRDGDKQQVGTFFLGRYRVVDEIGVGGMASVHLARMDGPGGFQKWVAIKRIHPHLVEDDQFVDMFLDEARIAAGINHANVAQVFDLGKDDNTYWIAMEYLHGEPLREIIRRQEERAQVIPPELAARICSDAAEGLHAAHELRGKNGQLLGLVHRDVTPHNLFVTYDGYTKVVDFGIAKVADRLSSTRAGTLKGKLAYMSPEQVRGAEVDRTTDVFALGVVLWELTTNQRLFRMDTDLDTLEKVQACVVPPPSTIVPGYPLELEAVVMKALAKRKPERFQTARELSRALQGFLMRRAAYVGPEEVAQFVRDLFADRIRKREAHLAWAAEVTSTINVDALQSGRVPGPEEVSVVSFDVEPEPAPASPPAPMRPPPSSGAPGRPLPPPSAPPISGPKPVGSAVATATAAVVPYAPQPSAPLPAMTADSLLDDDDDVPTTVATREHIEAGGAPGAYAAGADKPAAPRPAAGMPAIGFAPTQPFPGFSPGSFGAGPQRSGAAGFLGARQGAIADERTAALPVGEGLGGTIAMGDVGPLQAQLAEAERARQGRGSMTTPAPFTPLGGLGSGPGPSAPAFGPPPAAPAFGPPPAAPTFGPPPPAVFGSAPPSMQGMSFSPMQAFPGQRMPQSHIETALSLPRPDAAALWLAQQEAAGQRTTRRNTGVVIAVVVLTALCVIGIGALLYLKLRAPPASEIAPDGAGAVQQAPRETPAVAAASTAQAVSTPPVAAAPATAPSTVALASPAAPAQPTANAAAAAEDKSAKTAAAQAAKPADAPADKPVPAPAPPAEPGYLTIVCNPFCDDVIDQGRSLGPSPIVRLAVKPGQHRITLKRQGVPQKVISVIVVSGQVTAQRVSMR